MEHILTNVLHLNEATNSSFMARRGTPIHPVPLGVIGEQTHTVQTVTTQWSNLIATRLDVDRRLAKSNRKSYSADQLGLTSYETSLRLLTTRLGYEPGYNSVQAP